MHRLVPESSHRKHAAHHRAEPNQQAQQPRPGLLDHHTDGGHVVQKVLRYKAGVQGSTNQRAVRPALPTQKVKQRQNAGRRSRQGARSRRAEPAQSRRHFCTAGLALSAPAPARPLQFATHHRRRLLLKLPQPVVVLCHRVLVGLQLPAVQGLVVSGHLSRTGEEKIMGRGVGRVEGGEGTQEDPSI